MLSAFSGYSGLPNNQKSSATSAYRPRMQTLRQFDWGRTIFIKINYLSVFLKVCAIANYSSCSH